MTLRYLFGPVTAEFAEQNLKRQRQAGDCLTFNATGGTDLVIQPGDSWEEVCSRLPGDWRPDFVALYHQYTTIPACLWSAPVPIVGLAGDWNLLWHCYRSSLTCCDLVLVDGAGVDVFRRHGLAHVHAANLFGCGRDFLVSQGEQDGPRDIDILFVGNLHPAVQRERLAWLGRVARLGDRWRVVIRSGVFGEEYRSLLRRARIVFNRSIRGECNMRVFEAMTAGALLFQEAGNPEVTRYFQDRRHYVAYTEQDLEALLHHYLEHEDERRVIAGSGEQEVHKFSFEDLWQQSVEGPIPAKWDQLVESSKGRSPPEGVDALLGRTWQFLCSTDFGDSNLASEIGNALTADPTSATLRNALGLASTRLAQGAGPLKAEHAQAAMEHFRQAVDCDPAHVLAGLNLAKCLVALGHKQPALDQARRTLEQLDRQELLSHDVLESGHFPPGFDYFRVEWERAAWSHAGSLTGENQAKRELIRWRLHALLADLTGDLLHYEEAARVRSDLSPTQAALGCALGRAGRHTEAVKHLGQAVAGNPFDLSAARALFHALGQARDSDGRRRLVEDRRLLARAAPQAVPIETWVAEPAAKNPFQTVSLEDFQARFGKLDTSRAHCLFTGAQDTNAVLTLLVQARPRRIVEIGTAGGHMTANLTEWSPDDALIYTMGTVSDLPAASARVQHYEDPPRGEFGKHANHFGKVHKVFFITADSRHYDFRRIGTIDFAYIDGAHDFDHVLSDSSKVYEQLKPGGYMVWHDFNSPIEWVEVRQALEQVTIAEPIYHVAGTQVAFLHKQAPSGVAKQETFGIAWEGALRPVHSLAHVNRALCQKLIERGHDLSISLVEQPDLPTAEVPLSVEERIGRSLTRPVDVHVSHRWPPRFDPPPAGHWVIMQPWEFGSLPKSWVGPMTTEVDEVWSYSNSVRDCYVQSGVPADQVQVVPLGVDTARFHPQAQPLRLRTRRHFKFLFVGGTIYRKGIDILLDAYLHSFTEKHDVCLVIKDMGVGSFYQGQTAEQQIAHHRAVPFAPEIEYIDRPLTEEDLAGLYTACDCLVHPYRGEGFGLPIAEAMACGLPVIITSHGAALDFCTEEHGYFIPGKLVRFPEKKVGELETVDYPYLAEPDREVLKQLLRLLVERPEHAKAKGQRGAEHIRQNFTWDRSAAVVERRIAELKRKPIRRLHRVSPSIISWATSAKSASRQRISLAMIVKNEEDNLPDCIGPVADLFDEMIVVDTGSTDKTKEIAQRLGATVFDFPWVDSFAAARNESVKHATGDWIFWLDADDRVDQANKEKLRKLFADLPDRDMVGYSIKCACLPDPVNQTVTVVDHIRLFPNHPKVRWKYRVHEQILPAIRRLGGQVRFADVVVLHTGYVDRTLRGRKLERDLRLLNLENEENPDDPFTLFNLGSVYQEQGKLAEAIPVLRRSLERSQPADSIVRKLYALIAQSHRHLGQTAEALAACEEGRRYYPDDVEILFQESQLRRDRGDFAGAEACLLRQLERREGNHFASVDAGLAGYKARHNLAVLYQEQGRHADAEKQWQATVAENPRFAPGWLGLADLMLAQQRWADLEPLTGRMMEVGLSLEAEVSKARCHLARQEFAAARQLMGSAIARWPDSILARRILSHVLLQEGKDRVAAEQALLEILRLAPDDPETRNNLAVLRQVGP